MIGKFQIVRDPDSYDPARGREVRDPTLEPTGKVFPDYRPCGAVDEEPAVTEGAIAQLEDDAREAEGRGEFLRENRYRDAINIIRAHFASEKTPAHTLGMGPAEVQRSGGPTEGGEDRLRAPVPLPASQEI